MIRLIALVLIVVGGFSAYKVVKPVFDDVRGRVDAIDVPAADASSSRARVVRVVDGDTIRLRIRGEEKSVRLIGIDTPETRKPGVGVECGGKQATANLKRLAPAGAKARLTTDPTQDETDRYGRLIGYVSVRGQKLELEQIYDGWSKVYVYDRKFRRADDYQVAEGVAKRAHRGVWKLCGGDFHNLQP